MGCVRDPGSEEELASVGKLLGEVDRCREPSETPCHHSPLVNFSLSRPPDCIRSRRPFLPRVTPPEHKRYRIRMTQANTPASPHRVEGYMLSHS